MMQRTAAFLCALLLALPFAVQAANTAPAQGFDLGAMLMGGKLPVIFSALPQEQKEALQAEAAKDGSTIEFNSDGSTTITSKDGSVAVQHPDGTMTYRDAEGNEGRIAGAQWPDNELTRLVPKPDLTVATTNTEGDRIFAALFANPSIEQLRAYAEKVKAAGFSNNVKSEEQVAMGMKLFTFSASNADGVKVEIFSAMGTSGMSLEKAK
ncbi:MAG: hypothetical protein IJA79_08150 [Desulfovibrio sp.]|nr:hypothetical protein [Desulfovibrio sp.]